MKIDSVPLFRSLEPDKQLLVLSGLLVAAVLKAGGKLELDGPLLERAMRLHQQGVGGMAARADGGVDLSCPEISELPAG